MSHVIERLGHQGDGIAPGPIYAPRTLPGEAVSGTLDGTQLTDVRISTPSPDRVRPGCPVYQRCGGCALQHAAEPFVANWKVEVVRQALLAQNIEVAVTGPSTSPPASRRRARLAGTRTKKGAIVGFHGRASHTVVGAEQCIVVTPKIAALVPALEDLTKRIGTRRGEVSFEVLDTGAAIDLAVTGARPLLPDDFGWIAAWSAAHQVTRLTVDNEVVLQEGPQTLRIGSVEVVPPPGAFLQATLHGQDSLTALVQKALGDARHIVDLFAGLGTFALAIAEDRSVHAVEGAGDLIAALDHAQRNATGLKPVTTEVRDLFRNPLDADDLAGFDGAIIDPPRAGAASQTAHLARTRIARIAAVSCNPVTFARDARDLIRGGYTLGWVHVVDQFRWSPHVELAAGFTRED